MDYNNNPSNYQVEKKPTNGLAIAAMILGIASALTGWCYGVGLIFGIISIILAILSKKASNGRLSGMALAGLICSIFGIVISIVFWVFAIIGLTWLSEYSQSGGYDNIFDALNSLDTY